MAYETYALSPASNIIIITNHKKIKINKMYACEVKKIIITYGMECII